MSISYARKLNIKDFIFAHESIQQQYTSIKDANDLEQYLSKQKDGGKLYHDLVDRFVTISYDQQFFEWKVKEDEAILGELLTRVRQFDTCYEHLASICLDMLRSSDNEFNAVSLLHDASLQKLSDSLTNIILTHLRTISIETDTPFVHFACLAFGLKTHVDTLHYCTEKSPLLDRLYAYEERVTQFVKYRKQLNAESDQLRRSYYKNIHGKIFQSKKPRKKTGCGTGKRGGQASASADLSRTIRAPQFDYQLFLTEYAVASYSNGLPVDTAIKDLPSYFATRQVPKVRDSTRLKQLYDSFQLRPNAGAAT